MAPGAPGASALRGSRGCPEARGGAGAGAGAGSGAAGWREERLGAGAEARELAGALRLQWAHGFGQVPRGRARLTHGAHRYPAGMQAAAAAALLEGVLPGRVLLDPFCGGGTALVEGLRAGRSVVGRDLSPLAVFCSRQATWRPGLAAVEELEGAGPRAARRAEAAAGARGEAGAARPRWEDVQEAVEAESSGDPELEQALLFCVSAEREADSRRRKGGRQRRGGPRPPPIPERFERRVGRYAAGLRELEAVAPGEAPPSAPQPLPPADVARADARDGPGLPPGSVDAVLTSPPYPAVYDYLSDARRIRSFLGDSARSEGGDPGAYLGTPLPEGRDWPAAWTRGEIGARRALKRDPAGFEAAWQADQEAWLGATGEALARGGRAAVMVGDGWGLGDVGDSLRAAAAAVGLRHVASATLRSRQKRHEHLLLFEKPR